MTQLIQQDIDGIVAVSPLRSMPTSMGGTIQVRMTNCGQVGWVSDNEGYRYDRIDPLTGKTWPAMPAAWRRLATQVAQQAGFDGFDPDVALINRYVPGIRLGLHQDRDEVDLTQPVVSLSLGFRAHFVIGGRHRRDRTRHLELRHGDVMVMGGPSRLIYHGVDAVMNDGHAEGCRWNITFRKAR